MADEPLSFEFRPGKGKKSAAYLMSTYLRLWAGWFYIWRKVTWFDDSPDTGSPDCLCSWCLEVIESNSLAIRFFHPSNREVRLHPTCFKESRLGISIMNKQEE